MTAWIPHNGRHLAEIAARDDDFEGVIGLGKVEFAPSRQITSDALDCCSLKMPRVIRSPSLVSPTWEAHESGVCLLPALSIDCPLPTCIHGVMEGESAGEYHYDVLIEGILKPCELSVIYVHDLLVSGLSFRWAAASR